jgi:hypothetical protein
MLHLRDMRKRAAVPEEPDTSVLFRKAAMEFHTGLFATSAAAMIANELHTSYRPNVFYHIQQLRKESLPTPFKPPPVEIAVKVISHMI